MGAFLVLITLIYLSIQIRNNTKEVKSENAHRITDSFNQLNLLVASNERLAALWPKGMADYDDLSDPKKLVSGLCSLRHFESMTRSIIKSSVAQAMNNYGRASSTQFDGCFLLRACEPGGFSNNSLSVRASKSISTISYANRRKITPDTSLQWLLLTDSGC